MLRVEIFLSILAILWAFAFPRLGSRWFGRIEASFSKFAQRRTRSVALVGILAVVARLAVFPVLPVPGPAIEDEFSYLLMADTFAHGRVACPTHPMWFHFETFYVNQIPTYVSKYFPAQGIFLGLGQVVFGHPFWGVLLSSALMCAAICWMLQGWMPPAWALLGGLLAVLRLGTFSYWANSYWGGAVAALGGALVLGALPRIKKNQRVQDAVWMGIGLALLFNSRPYETLFFATPIAIALLVWIMKKNEQPLQRKILRAILPLGIALTITVAAMVFYFWKTTGNPFQPPYVAYESTHSNIPLFPWMHRGPSPSYSSSTLRNAFEGRLLEHFNFAVQHPFQSTLLRIVVFWLFYLGPTLTVPFLMLLFMLPYGAKVSHLPRPMKFLLFVISVTFAGVLVPVYFQAHYAAAVTALVYAFVLFALQYVRACFVAWKPVGLSISRAVVVSCALLIGIRISAPFLQIPLTPAKFATWAAAPLGFPQRAAIVSELNELDGGHLVLVLPQTDPRHEALDWVYNAADIDASKIVWARDLGPAKNRELIDYYKDRSVWIVDPMQPHPRLMPYPMISQMQAPNPAAITVTNTK
jgi:hypothetical protein